MSCAKISSGVTFVCPPPPAGIDADQIVIFNWDDIDRDANVPVSATLTSISLLGGALGYIYEGVNNSVEANYESVIEGYNPYKVNHNLVGRIFNDNQLIADLENDVLSGTFVIVYFTKSGRVKVMGWEVGVKAVISRNYKEEDGAALMTFATPADEFEISVPLDYVGAASPVAGFETLKAEIIALT